MPEVECFIPSIWASDDFDSDGDFYHTNIGDRWGNLELSKTDSLGKETTLDVNVFREKNRIYEPGLEVSDLKRFIDYKNNGRYKYESVINNIENMCVTSLWFESPYIKFYKEFLDTVYFYLKNNGGVLMPFHLDHIAFREKFLDK